MASLEMNGQGVLSWAMVVRPISNEGQSIARVSAVRFSARVPHQLISDGVPEVAVRVFLLHLLDDALHSCRRAWSVWPPVDADKLCTWHMPIPYVTLESPVELPTS